MADLFNPFYKAQLGSYIKPNGDWGDSLISPDATISSLLLRTDVQTFMSGKSEYVYSDQMNQGSIGISGSYGVSGVRKLSSAIAVYKGDSSAQSAKVTSMDCNIRIISGIENINFNNMSIISFLAGLQEKPRLMIEKILNLYVSITKAADKDKEDLIKSWGQALTNFNKSYGDSLVVGVVWGGIGVCSLKITEKASQQKEAYGGSGNFTYSGVGGGVSVDATYNGSNSTQVANVEANSVAQYSGEIAAKPVLDWKALFEGKAFDAIKSIKPLDSAPVLSPNIKPPAIPDFVAPKASDSVASKIKDITSIEGLKALALAKAYDQAGGMIDGKKVSLDEFIKLSEQKVNNKTLDKLDPDKIDPLELSSANDLGTLAIDDSTDTEDSVTIASPDTPTLKASKGTDGYAVLGTWIAKWADIFPWMSTAYLNQVDTIGFAKETLKKQCMIQDFLTLSNLHKKFTNLDITYNKSPINCTEISDSFRNRMTFLQDNISKTDAVQNAYAELTPDAQKIYDTWNRNPIFRKAELGFGIIVNSRDTKNVSYLEERSYATKFKAYRYYSQKCAFLPNKSYSTFSQLLHVLPFIMPDGSIFAITLYGDIVLTYGMGAGDESLYGSTNTAFYPFLPFRYDSTKNALVDTQNKGIEMYPIPFKASKGITWKGQNFSTNISSNGGLQEKLNNLKDELSQLNVYSVSSDNWDNWNPDFPYIDGELNTQYIGIVNVDKTD